MWESVLGCGAGEGRGMGGVGERKEICGGMCGLVYGVSVEGVGKCVREVKGEVWGVLEKIRGNVEV